MGGRPRFGLPSVWTTMPSPTVTTAAEAVTGCVACAGPSAEAGADIEQRPRPARAPIQRIDLMTSLLFQKPCSRRFVPGAVLGIPIAHGDVFRWRDPPLGRLELGEDLHGADLRLLAVRSLECNDDLPLTVRRDREGEALLGVGPRASVHTPDEIVSGDEVERAR